MSPQLQKLFDEARQLSAKDRVDLANQLLESINEEFADDETDDTWPDGYPAELSAEIQRREAEFDSGMEQAVPHVEAMRLMFGR